MNVWKRAFWGFYTLPPKCFDFVLISLTAVRLASELIICNATLTEVRCFPTAYFWRTAGLNLRRDPWVCWIGARVLSEVKFCGTRATIMPVYFEAGESECLPWVSRWSQVSLRWILSGWNIPARFRDLKCYIGIVGQIELKIARLNKNKQAF